MADLDFSDLFLLRDEPSLLSFKCGGPGVCKSISKG